MGHGGGEGGQCVDGGRGSIERGVRRVCKSVYEDMTMKFRKCNYKGNIYLNEVNLSFHHPMSIQA